MVSKYYKFSNLIESERLEIEATWIKEGSKKSLSKYWEDNRNKKFKHILVALEKRLRKKSEHLEEKDLLLEELESRQFEQPTQEREKLIKRKIREQN